MGKKEEDFAKQQEELTRLRLPRKNEGEMFGIVTQLLGSNNIRVLCEDSIERVCRIPGKMMKKVWLRVDDIVIVKIWDFQPTRADVVWRYTSPVEIDHLKKKGYLNNLPV